MATSIYRHPNTTLTATNEYLRGYFEVMLNSQDVVARTSNITVYLYLTKLSSSSSSTTGEFSGKFTINGVAYSYTSSSKTLTPGGAWVLIASKTVTVTHNPDGSLTIPVKVSTTYAGRTSSTMSQLEVVIPQLLVTTPITATDGTLGTASVSITLDRADGATGWTHTLTAGGITIASRMTGDTILWNPPEALASLAPTTTTFQLDIECTAFNAEGVQLGTSKATVTLTIPATYKPTGSISLSIPTYGSTYGYVAGVTKLRVVTNLTKTYGSPVTYECIINGVTYATADFTTLQPLQTSGSVLISMKVTDGRGRSTTFTQTITVNAYNLPVVLGFSVIRSNSSGTTVTEGTYAKISLHYEVTSLSNKNTVSLVLQYKLRTSSTWITIPTTSWQVSGKYPYVLNSFLVYGSADGTVISASKEYDFQVALTDAFYPVSSNSLLRTFDSILNLKANGAAIGFGTAAGEDGTATFGYKLKMDKGYVSTRLSNGVSLNSVTSPGYYHGDTSWSITGLPSGTTGVFGLAVFPTGPSTIKQQISFQNGTYPVYERHYTTSLGWTSWYLVTPTVPTNPGDIGAAGIIHSHTTMEVQGLDTQLSQILTDISGVAGQRIVTGLSANFSTASITSGSKKSASIPFGVTFNTVPFVIVTPYQDGDYSGYYQYAVGARTTTAFTLYVTNLWSGTSGSTQSEKIFWIAIGT